jgi:hypothetical protein
MTREDAQQEIARESEAGESLLWYGVPRQGVVFRPSDAFQIPFSLFWCGFAIFWETTVVTTKAPFFFKLWGIPFVLMGLYIMVGRFFVDSMQRAKVAYGLTNRRAIIISGLRSRNVKSLPLKTLSDVTLSEKSDASGTIALGPASPFARYYGNGAWPGNAAMMTPSFEMIDDAKSVYSTLRSAQSTAQSAA